jgi:hypothetical protein
MKYVLLASLVFATAAFSTPQTPDSPQDAGSTTGDGPAGHGNNPPPQEGDDALGCNSPAAWEMCEWLNWNPWMIRPEGEVCFECYEIAYATCSACIGSYQRAMCINAARSLFDECSGLYIEAYSTFTGTNYDDLYYVVRILVYD